jgi:hypothetical protein
MSDTEAPPAVRAPSSRASKGNRMARLLAQEEDAAEEGDKDFYEQEFWADAEGDAEYAMDADDEQGNDSFDSDFGDSSESDGDDDEEGKAEKAVRAAKPKKRSVYTDPNSKGKAGSSSSAPKKPRKRPHPELTELTGLQPIQRGSLRASTKVRLCHAGRRESATPRRGCCTMMSNTTKSKADIRATACGEVFWLSTGPGLGTCCVWHRPLHYIPQHPTLSCPVHPTRRRMPLRLPRRSESRLWSWRNDGPASQSGELNSRGLSCVGSRKRRFWKRQHRQRSSIVRP